MWTLKNNAWWLKCSSGIFLKLISSGYSVWKILKTVLKIISFIILACMGITVLFEIWNEMEHSIKHLYLNLHMVLSLATTDFSSTNFLMAIIYLFILNLSLLVICFYMGFWFNHQALYFSYYLTYIDGHS